MKKGNISEKNNFQFFTEVNKDNNINHIELIKSPIFQKELIFFKNEILKDINILTKEISEKYEKFDLIFKSETSKLNTLISNSDSKIKNLSNLIPLNNQTQEILDSLISFKKRTESYITSNDIRLSNLVQDFSNEINRHDKLLKESIIYPGVIGPSAQFKNFHDLIDYFLKNIKDLLKYKEQSSMDFITYKSKIDTKFDIFQKQIDEYIDDINHENQKKFNKIEDKYKQIDLKLNEISYLNKIENEKNLNNINKNNNIFLEKIEEKIKNINEYNIEIKNKLKKIEHKELHDNTIKSTINYKQKNFKNRNFIQKENYFKTTIPQFAQESNNNNNNNKNNIAYQKNKEIKNLENDLKKFIMEEIKKIYKNYFDKQLIKNTLSHEKKFFDKKFDKINVKDINRKRSTLIPDNLTKKIFDNFLKSNEDKKEYDHNKIIEENSKKKVTNEQISKKTENDKDKFNNFKALTEENRNLNETEFLKDKNNNEVTLVKPEKIIDEKTETIQNNKTLNINKNIKKGVPSLSLNFSNSFSSNIEKGKSNIYNLKRKINKPKLNIKLNTFEKFIEEKKELISKTNNINNSKTLNNNNNEQKNNINNTSPKIKPNRKLSSFEITLKGTKKINLDSIPNKKYLFNSPTIYMNFPRKYSVYSEKFLESLHPPFRNKKFSKIISPHISLMTNNLQEMIRHYDKKNVQQRKRNLPWTKSDNVLINKNKEKDETSPEMIFGKRKSKIYYKKLGDDYIKLDDDYDLISYNKFINLIMKDI